MCGIYNDLCVVCVMCGMYVWYLSCVVCMCGIYHVWYVCMRGMRGVYVRYVRYVSYSLLPVFLAWQVQPDRSKVICSLAESSPSLTVLSLYKDLGLSVNKLVYNSHKLRLSSGISSLRG